MLRRRTGAAAQIPPPPEIVRDPELEPQVTITRRDSETVKEARVAGQGRLDQVTPRHGFPYSLIPGPGGRPTCVATASTRDSASHAQDVIFTF
ncbi:MAG: DUF2782 domain-containing protein [Betaproteobacteria bacterium]|nr:DUF2782 domain-containing protein [Betaproteobacteria bacterium]